DITYSFYPVYCQLYDVQYRKVPLTDRFTINPDDYGIENGGIIFPNPNAPTGTAMALEQVEAILKANPDSVVVVDEAYVDFGAASAVSLLPSYPNLLVVQTFSKSRSLAALRIGFALGSAELVDALERVKNSFNSYPVDRLAQQAAVASLADEAYFESTCQRIISTRDNLTRELSLLDFEVLPSSANFVFARHRVRDAREISQHLRSQSVIVRYFEKDRIDQFLRITIGTEKECDTLISVLKDYLS
ncbi:MAG: aminotransferase class I/II-fold pyridoxal phosphate-dependent enzyme, partial [Pseudomonadales bacterium]|nr:aminotransferase class I/II-fold pyridoxal phosphate-dependent enzyme [Pseudomonadales bacterium]